MVRTRIAPSPTGEPHIGNIYTALINYAYAKGREGSFILRVEDTDRERFVPGAEDQFKETLRWLDVSPDEGPDQGGPYSPYRQSDKLEVYQDRARELVESGRAYHCFCTAERLDQMREDQQKKGLQPKYDRRCLSLSPKEVEQRLANGEPHVIRLRVPDEGVTKFTDLVRGEVVFENALIDDQVLLKSDGFPTYHLGVVIDDHFMKIDPVVRAEEWISSTPKQILLYEAFGWEMPQFAHLPLLRNPDGSKMSKRRNAVSALWYREQGFLPQALKNYLMRLGWSHPQDKEIFDFSEFVELFDFDRVSTSAPVFDIQKLEWVNGLYIREKISDREYWKMFLGFVPEKIKSHEGVEEKLKELAPLFRERLKRFSEVPELISYFFTEELSVDEGLLIEQSGDGEKAGKMLESARAALGVLEGWKLEEVENCLRELCDRQGWGKREFFMTIRVAVSGRTATPPLFDTLWGLGRELTLGRLEEAVAELEDEC